MEILAHRGLWSKEEEKNSLWALEKAFNEGFGVETDIRDFQGTLVISHDIADTASPSAREMLMRYVKSGSNSTIALNLKSDGLQALVCEHINEFGLKNYFLFDMSIPELVVNVNRKLKFYTRHSDIEPVCVQYEQAAGVWMDSFYDACWLTEDKIRKHLDNGKQVGIISPEIHHFQHKEIWKQLRRLGNEQLSKVKLCTDLPLEAREFFGL